MTDKHLRELLASLSPQQKEILKTASTDPDATILFNIKGMVEILHSEGPFTFVEMGHRDIEVLKKKGLIALKPKTEKVSVLQGESYAISHLGHEISKLI